MKAMDADGSLQAAFAKLDVDKSGYLDHKELRNALKTVGMEMDSSKATELLAQYDKDGDGKMELDEFVPLVLALRAVNLNLADEEAGLRAAFDKFDTNRSGKLDHKELRSALASVKLELDSEGAKVRDRARRTLFLTLTLTLT